MDAELRRVRVRELSRGRELGGRTVAAHPFDQVEAFEIEYVEPFVLELRLRLDSGKTLAFGQASTSSQARMIGQAVVDLVGCPMIEVLPARVSPPDHEEPTVRLFTES